MRRTIRRVARTWTLHRGRKRIIDRLRRSLRTRAGRIVIVALVLQFTGLSCLGTQGESGTGGGDSPEQTASIRSALSADDLDPTKPFRDSVTRAVLPTGGTTLPNALSGAPDVRADGSASYGFPIEIPDGVEGIQPTLSVDYQSRRGPGLLGPGWNLGGLSAIVRCRRTVAQDGNDTVATLENSIPRFLSDDRYCLDGVRLVNKTGAIPPGTAGADFYPEDGSAIKVVVETTDSTRGPTHTTQPLTFKVYFADGRIGYYGSSASSRIEMTDSVAATVSRYAFYVERIEDRFGNSIKFSYTRATPTTPADTTRVVEPMPDRIAYTNTGSSVGPHEIVFSYVAAAKTRVRFIEKLSIETKTLLSSIVINSAFASFDTAGTPVAGPVRLYQFSYDTSSGTGFSVLHQIQRCTAIKDSSGAAVPDVCTAPTTIGWTTNAALSYERIPLDSIADIVPTGAQNFARLTTADVDNDGRDDLIYKVGVDASCAKWVYRRSTGRDFGSPIDMGFQSTCAAGNIVGDKFKSDIFPANLDNRGAIDFVVPIHTVAQGFNGFSAALTRNDAVQPVFASFDFDAFASNTGDIVTRTDPNIAFGEVQPMVPSVLRPFITAGSFGTWNTYQVSIDAQSIPAVAFSGTVGQYFSAWPPVFIDLNGDGYDELVSPDSTATIFGGIVTQLATNLPLLRNGGTVTGRFWFMDVNGDGYRDAAYVSTSDSSPGSILRVRMNKGDYTFGPDIVTNLATRFTIGVSGIRSDIDTGVRVADVNLDGLDDMLLVDNGATLNAGTIDNGIFVSRRSHVEALISKGDGTFTTADAVQTDGISTIVLGDIATGFDNLPTPLQGYRLTQTLDADGDGLTDIVQTEGGKLRLYLRSGGIPELVTTITEGGNRTITYTHQALDKSSRFTLTSACRDVRAPSVCATRGKWTVSDLTITGLMPRHLAFSYQDPYADRGGRGFQGFRMRIIEDTERTTRTVIQYSDVQLFDTSTGIQPAKYFFQPSLHVFEYVRQGSGKLVVSNTLRNVDVASVVEGREIVSSRSGQTTISDCTEAGQSLQCVEFSPRTLSRTVDNSSYDAYGHMIKSNVTTSMPNDPVDVMREKSIAYNEIDTGTWLLNVPNSVSETSIASSGESTTLQIDVNTDGIRLRSRSIGEEQKRREERFTYDTRGRLTEVVALDSSDQDGLATRHTIVSYDGPGGIYPTDVQTAPSLNVFQSVGKTWRHPAFGYLVQQVDANSVLQRQTFDASGRQMSMTDARTAPITFGYGFLSNGSRWQITSTFGSEKQVDDLDVLGRVIKHSWTTTTGTMASEARGYDLLGHLTSLKSLFADNNYETSYSFDSLERPTSTCTNASRTLAAGTPVAPAFECLTIAYDGHKTTVTSPEGVVTETTTDEAGRVLSKIRSGTNPGSSSVLTDTTQFTYAPFNKLENVTGSAGTVVFAYDERMRLLTMSRFPKLTTYTYNNFDEVISEQQVELDSVTGTAPVIDRFVIRDLAGRPTQDNGGTFVWDTAANGRWRLASSRSVDGISTAHTYNANGLPASDAWTIGAESFAFDRTYDTKGRIDTVTYPQAGTFGRLNVKYNYNQFTGLVDRLVDVGTGKVLWQAVLRNAIGQVQSETMNGGQVKQITKFYEGGLLPFNVTFQSGTTTTLNEDLQYYPGGNLKSRKSTLGASVATEQMVFDGLNRLWQWTPNDSSTNNLVTYSYACPGDCDHSADSRAELGGRSVFDEDVTYTKSEVPGTATTNYVARLSLFNGRTGTTGTYDSDALGRTTSTPAGTFTYTPYDLPKRFVATSGAATDYLYDALKGGVQKNLSGGDQEIALAGLFRRVKSGTATTYEHSLFVEGQVVGTIEHRSTGGAYANVEFYHRDQVGSQRATAAGTNPVVRSATRDPYGNRLGGGTPYLPSDTGSVAGGGFHGYQEQRHDLGAGLIDMKGRYYSPRIGRFMSDDPVIGDLMDGRAYSAKAFVYGNPVRLTDPTGFCGQPEGDGRDCNPNGGLLPVPLTETLRNLAKGAARAGHAVHEGVGTGYHGTVDGLVTAYDSTSQWIYKHLNPFYNDQQPRGPSVPAASNAPIAGAGTPTSFEGGANRHSAVESTTGSANQGADTVNGVPNAGNVPSHRVTAENSLSDLVNTFGRATALCAGGVCSDLAMHVLSAEATAGVTVGGNLSQPWIPVRPFGFYGLNLQLRVTAVNGLSIGLFAVTPGHGQSLAMDQSLALSVNGGLVWGGWQGYSGASVNYAGGFGPWGMGYSQSPSLMSNGSGAATLNLGLGVATTPMSGGYYPTTYTPLMLSR